MPSVSTTSSALSAPRSDWRAAALDWVASGYFFGFALVVSTMTYLRIGPLSYGPTEFLLVSWMGASLLRTTPPIPAGAYRLALGLFLFLALACAGWLSHTQLPIAQDFIVRDLIALTASATISVILFLRVHQDPGFLRPLLSTIVFVAPIAYLAIFGEEYVHLFNLNPWWAHRYMGWAHNPNQTALLFVTLPFLAVYLLQTETARPRQWLYATAALACAFLGAQTYSHGIRVGWSLALFASFLSFGCAYFRYGRGRSCLRFYAYFGLPVLGLVAVSPKILAAIRSMSYAQNDKGYLRFVLWDNGLAALAQSPYFGLGAANVSGVNGAFGGSEPHNSFVDFAVFAGPLAGIAFVVVCLWLLLRVIRREQWVLVGAITAFLGYSVFGGYFRHPLYWCLLQAFYWLSVPQALSRARAPRNASAASPITASP